MMPVSQHHPRVFLKPGELAIAETPTRISTVLGSCVAVTFHSPRLKFGAICHAVLPYGSGSKDFKYVDEAVEHMLDRFAQLGVARHEIEVKLFGGSDVLPKLLSRHSPLSVGQQNIAAAKQQLESRGLKLQVEHIGGPLGRKIHFYSHTGEVLLKRVAKVAELSA
jgi:chemotaxis protein CheD